MAPWSGPAESPRCVRRAAGRSSRRSPGRCRCRGTSTCCAGARPARRCARGTAARCRCRCRPPKSTSGSAFVPRADVDSRRPRRGTSRRWRSGSEKAARAACRSAMTVGSRVRWRLPPRIPRCAAWRFPQAAANALPQSADAGALPCVRTREIRQQVVDEHAHAVGGVVGAASQSSAADESAQVALGQLLRIALDRAQRLAQVVGDDVAELLQGRVGPLQFLARARPWRSSATRCSSV